MFLEIPKPAALCCSSNNNANGDRQPEERTIISPRKQTLSPRINAARSSRTAAAAAAKSPLEAKNMKKSPVGTKRMATPRSKSFDESSFHNDKNELDLSDHFGITPTIRQNSLKNSILLVAPSTTTRPKRRSRSKTTRRSLSEPKNVMLSKHHRKESKEEKQEEEEYDTSLLLSQLPIETASATTTSADDNTLNASRVRSKSVDNLNEKETDEVEGSKREARKSEEQKDSNVKSLENKKAQCRTRVKSPTPPSTKAVVLSLNSSSDDDDATTISDAPVRRRGVFESSSCFDLSVNSDDGDDDPKHLLEMVAPVTSAAMAATERKPIVVKHHKEEGDAMIHPHSTRSAIRNHIKASKADQSLIPIGNSSFKKDSHGCSPMKQMKKRPARRRSLSPKRDRSPKRRSPSPKRTTDDYDDDINNRSEVSITLPHLTPLTPPGQRSKSEDMYHSGSISSFVTPNPSGNASRQKLILRSKSVDYLNASVSSIAPLNASLHSSVSANTAPVDIHKPRGRGPPTKLSPPLRRFMRGLSKNSVKQQSHDDDDDASAATNEETPVSSDYLANSFPSPVKRRKPEDNQQKPTSTAKTTTIPKLRIRGRSKTPPLKKENRQQQSGNILKGTIENITAFPLLVDASSSSQRRFSRRSTMDNSNCYQGKTNNVVDHDQYHHNSNCSSGDLNKGVSEEKNYPLSTPAITIQAPRYRRNRFSRRSTLDNAQCGVSSSSGANKEEDPKVPRNVSALDGGEESCLEHLNRVRPSNASSDEVANEIPTPEDAVPTLERRQASRRHTIGIVGYSYPDSSWGNLNSSVLFNSSSSTNAAILQGHPRRQGGRRASLDSSGYHGNQNSSMEAAANRGVRRASLDSSGYDCHNNNTSPAATAAAGAVGNSRPPRGSLARSSSGKGNNTADNSRDHATANDDHNNNSNKAAPLTPRRRKASLCASMMNVTSTSTGPTQPIANLPFNESNGNNNVAIGNGTNTVNGKGINSSSALTPGKSNSPRVPRKSFVRRVFKNRNGGSNNNDSEDSDDGGKYGMKMLTAMFNRSTISFFGGDEVEISMSETEDEESTMSLSNSKEKRVSLVEEEDRDETDGSGSSSSSSSCCDSLKSFEYDDEGFQTVTSNNDYKHMPEAAPISKKKSVSFPQKEDLLVTSYYEPILIEPREACKDEDLVLRSDLYWSVKEMKVVQVQASKNGQVFRKDYPALSDNFQKWYFGIQNIAEHDNRVCDYDSFQLEEVFREGAVPSISATRKVSKDDDNRTDVTESSYSSFASLAVDDDGAARGSSIRSIPKDVYRWAASDARGLEHIVNRGMIKKGRQEALAKILAFYKQHRYDEQIADLLREHSCNVSYKHREVARLLAIADATVAAGNEDGNFVHS